MTDKELEQKLSQAFIHATPDVLDSVLTACDEQKGKVITMTKKNKTNWFARVGSIAAALVLVAGLGFGFYGYRMHHTVATTVSLDVNPSLEIRVNQKEKVLEVLALNEDGKDILDDMDFEGSDIDVTVNALIGSMLRKGYLSDISNSILVSVDGKDSEALQQRLAQEVNTLLQTGSFSGAVISQTVTHTDELDALAQQHGISTGKAKLIQRIVDQNTRYTFDDLAALSINELNLLSESGNLHLDSVTSTGAASKKSYIGNDNAKAVALTHADVDEGDIRGFEIDMEYEKGVMVYEIEFDTSDHEYEYDINAVSGEVVWYEKEARRTSPSEQPDPTVPPASDPTEPTTGSDVPAPTTGTDIPASAQPQLITKEAARDAALAHAGITADAIREYKNELDRDHGTDIYEIEFEDDQYEYDYDIDAATGAVLRYEKKPHRDDDNDIPAGSTQQSALMTKDEAKQIALNHAGVSADAVRDYECELDNDHGTQVYEIEFQSGDTEYEYKIDAAAGSILHFESDRDD